MKFVSKLAVTFALAIGLVACGNQNEESSSISDAIDATKEAASDAVDATAEAVDAAAEAVEDASEQAVEMAEDAGCVTPQD